MIYLIILFILLLCFSISKGTQYPVGVNMPLWKRYRGIVPIFLILAFFSAIRDDCGCDYNSYIIHIQKIQNGEFNYMEPGFQAFVNWVYQFHENPRLVIILIGILTSFFFVLAIWKQSEDRKLSIYLLITWGYYIMTYNTIRNYFALSFMLCLIPILIKKKYLLFSLLTIFIALFHKSALFCIPIYIVASKITIKRKHIIPLIILGCIFLAMEPYFRQLVFMIYDFYEGSEYDDRSISYLNILKALTIICLFIRYKSKLHSDSLCKLYFNLNVFALFIYTSLFWLPEISRLGFYLNVTSVLIIPNILQKIPNLRERAMMRRLVYIGSFVLFLLLLIQFSAENSRLLPYKTWLFNGLYNIY